MTEEYNKIVDTFCENTSNLCSNCVNFHIVIEDMKDYLNIKKLPKFLKYFQNVFTFERCKQITVNHGFLTNMQSSYNSLVKKYSEVDNSRSPPPLRIQHFTKLIAIINDIGSDKIKNQKDFDTRMKNIKNLFAD